MNGIDKLPQSLKIKISSSGETEKVNIITGVSPRSLTAWLIEEVIINYDPPATTWASWVSLDKKGDITDTLPSFDDNPLFMLGAHGKLTTSGGVAVRPTIFKPVSGLVIAATQLYVKHTAVGNVDVYVEIRYRTVKIKASEIIEFWESNLPQVEEG